MRHVFIAVIRMYQRYVSRWTPAVCRFRPTCSEYAVQALARYGALKGSAMALGRICRCHPFHPGGDDPVQ
ncbi:MAG: membrane protein insertion efficiency factor YidD [Armatimonadetes bacterium]|nr:membrane protein insertion efficiency factor YidD [Armatimonadota bacterium]